LLGIDHAAYFRDEALRQVAVPLQRGQTRSPTHELSNVLRQLRQTRAFRGVSSALMLCSFFMPIIWVSMLHVSRPRPFRAAMRGLSPLSFYKPNKSLSGTAEPIQGGTVHHEGRGIPAFLPALTTGASKMKLQEMIDAAFGEQPTPPAPQVMGEAVKDRARAFAARADKIESLRLARLASADEPPLAPLLFEVVRLRGHWRTRHGGKSSAAFPDQASAIVAAKKLAIAKREQGKKPK